MVCMAFAVFLKVINMINDNLIQRIPTKYMDWTNYYMED